MHGHRHGDESGRELQISAWLNKVKHRLAEVLGETPAEVFGNGTSLDSKLARIEEGKATLLGIIDEKTREAGEASRAVEGLERDAKNWDRLQAAVFPMGEPRRILQVEDSPRGQRIDPEDNRDWQAIQQARVKEVLSKAIWYDEENKPSEKKKALQQYRGLTSHDRRYKWR